MFSLAFQHFSLQNMTFFPFVIFCNLTKSYNRVLGLGLDVRRTVSWRWTRDVPLRWAIKEDWKCSAVYSWFSSSFWYFWIKPTGKDAKPSLIYYLLHVKSQTCENICIWIGETYYYILENFYICIFLKNYSVYNVIY